MGPGANYRKKKKNRSARGLSLDLIVLTAPPMHKCSITYRAMLFLLPTMTARPMTLPAETSGTEKKSESVRLTKAQDRLLYAASVPCSDLSSIGTREGRCRRRRKV